MPHYAPSKLGLYSNVSYRARSGVGIVPLRIDVRRVRTNGDARPTVPEP